MKKKKSNFFFVHVSALPFCTYIYPKTMILPKRERKNKIMLLFDFLLGHQTHSIYKTHV